MNSLLTLHIKWRSIVIRFDNVDPTLTTVLAVKQAIEEKTGISPLDQKLLGLGIKITNSTTADANTRLCDAAYKTKNGMIMVTLVGTPQIELIEQQAREIEQLGLQSKQIFNDLDLGSISPATREWRKLQEFSAKVEVQFLSPSRPGKKLLVLDLDHTLLHFDSKEEGQPSSSSGPASHVEYVGNLNPSYSNSMKRPYMDYFLAAVYPYYDIAIWSQTHWKWIEIKLTER